MCHPNWEGLGLDIQERVTVYRHETFYIDCIDSNKSETKDNSPHSVLTVYG